MVIGIDLDGVVFDTEEYYRTYSHLYDLAFVKNGLIDKKEMHVHKRYKWEQKYADDFYAKYTEEVLNNAPFKPGARYVLSELKKMGHKLVCITLRGYYRECERTITEKRLKEANVEFDRILYNQKNKLISCQNEKIDIMIDDNPDTMKLLAKNNIKCFHFRGAGLRKVNHKNVVEVQNWADIMEKLIIKNN